MPVLHPGRHLTPEDGACLMEYVSVLAGRPFSDRPSCTDPTLAMVARMVNDASTDRGRGELSRFAVALARTPRTGAVEAARLVLTVVTAAAAALGSPARLQRHERGARRRLRRVTGDGAAAALSRRLDSTYRQGSGRRHVEAAVSALRVRPEADRDAGLEDLLAAALEILSPPAPPGRATDPAPSQHRRPAPSGGTGPVLPRPGSPDGLTASASA
jgi:hypothetical protein